MEKYPEFLASGQELLAEAANQFLEELLNGPSPVHQVDYATVLSTPGTAQVAENGTEKTEIKQLLVWLEEKKLPKPELDFELCERDSTDVLTIVGAAWPKGLQEGYSQPVAVVLEDSEDTEIWANLLGYRLFTSLPLLYRYIEKEILGDKV